MVRADKIFQAKHNEALKRIALLIQEASLFESSIYIHLDGKKANAKSLLGMMSLGIVDGVTIGIECNGSDEEQALSKILAFLQE